MGAPAARASELARHWAADGHEVTVLTGFPNHPTGILHAEYRSKIWRMVVREQFEGAKVVRTWLAPLPNRKAHERILNYSSFCISAAVTGSFLPRCDVVIATSPQLLVGLSGYFISRLRGVPLVFEVRDLWPESLAAVGVSGPDSLMNRTLGRIAKFLYQAAERIVVVSPAFQPAITRNWGIPEEKISVVENGVETDLFSPEPGGMAPGKKFVVSYIGTMGNAHGLTTLLDAAGMLQNSNPEIEFLLVGEGAEKAALMSQAAQKNLTNIRWMPQQPREKIPGIIRESDVCLVLLRKSEVFETVIPTKMLEFMSCGRPLVLGVRGQAQQIVQAAQCGICISPEEPAELAQAIQKLHGDAELRKRLGSNGRQYILEHFCRKQLSRKYTGVLNAVLERKSPHPLPATEEHRQDPV